MQFLQEKKSFSLPKGKEENSALNPGDLFVRCVVVLATQIKKIIKHGKGKKKPQTLQPPSCFQLLYSLFPSRLQRFFNFFLFILFIWFSISYGICSPLVSVWLLWLFLTFEPVKADPLFAWREKDFPPFQPLPREDREKPGVATLYI